MLGVFGGTSKIKYPISDFPELSLKRCSQLAGQLSAKPMTLTEVTIGHSEM